MSEEVMGWMVEIDDELIFLSGKITYTPVTYSHLPSYKIEATAEEYANILQDHHESLFLSCKIYPVYKQESETFKEIAGLVVYYQPLGTLDGARADELISKCKKSLEKLTTNLRKSGVEFIIAPTRDVNPHVEFLSLR